MLADPSKVMFQVWFIPEHGIEQPPTLINTVCGYVDAWGVATDYQQEDFKEPEHYGQMYADSRGMLAKWLADPHKWGVALPVHYGTLVIA